jgi:hypothetical protein
MTTDEDPVEPEVLPEEIVHWQPGHRRLASPQQNVAVRRLALGAVALGAFAVGALAIGALAIGSLAVGRLAVGRARFRRLEVDDLVVRRWRMRDED